MFKPVDQPSAWTEIILNDIAVRVPEGSNLAAAILMHSTHCRTTAVSSASRGPFCMMGVCFDCLVKINGIDNQQACMRTVEPGMQVVFQRGAVSLNDRENA